MNSHSKSSKINFVITIWLAVIMIALLYTIQYFGFTNFHLVSLIVILALLAISNITTVLTNLKLANTQSQSEKYGSR